MTGWYEPDSLIGLGGLVLLILGSWAQTVYGQRKARAGLAREHNAVESIRVDVTEVKKQVRNDHPALPSLRDDIDELRCLLVEFGRDSRAIRSDVYELRVDVGELRGELRADRRALEDLEDRIRSWVQIVHPDVKPP